MSGGLRRALAALALLAAPIDAAPSFIPPSVAATEGTRPAEAAESGAEIAGEWRCRIWHGGGGGRGVRELRMILEPDGSWLLQGLGPQSAAYLVLGTWFRAPKGQIYASGRVTRWGGGRGGGLGPLFAVELTAREGRLVSEEDPRADCRRS